MCGELNDGCALAGRHGRAHRHRPYPSPSYFSTQSHTNEINRPTRNPPKRIRLGGACVPAQTSAQRRFHTKNTRIMRGEFNDGCALAGRHGRAHRRRPYQPPSYFSTQSHTNKIPSMRNSPQTKSTVPHVKYTHCARGMNDGCALAGRHGRAHRHRPYQTPLYIYTHIGGENASRTPAPILKIKKCVYRYDFGVTVDNAICFKTSYSLGVPWMTSFVLKQVMISVSP